MYTYFICYVSQRTFKKIFYEIYKIPKIKAVTNLHNYIVDFRSHLKSLLDKTFPEHLIHQKDTARRLPS